MAISRRQLFKGLSLGAGSMLFSPVLQSLAAHAAGSPLLPKRFVFVLQVNGIQPWAFYPRGGNLPNIMDDPVAWKNSAGATIGRAYKQPEQVTSRSLTPYELPQDIEPLTPFKDRLLLIQGLHGVHTTPAHGGSFAALAGSMKRFNRPVAQTIDVALAQAHPGPFPLVNLGIDPTRRKTTTYCCSAYGPSQPVPTQCRPEAAYDMLFGSVAGGSAKQDFQMRGQLLDFARDDVRKLNGQLAGPEREKLGFYLNALESMHQRQARIKEMEEVLKKRAPLKTARPELMTEVIASQFEIGGAALICGLTNVLTVISGCSDCDGVYTGLTTQGVHAVGHGEGDDKRNGLELNTHIRNFHFQHVAKLMKQLEEIPEGDGTMLDNTLFICTSDNADSQHTSGKQWPFLLAGNVGQRLKTGRLVEYPAYGTKGNRSINALYATLLEAAGKPRDHFNLEGSVKDADVPGPLSDLLS